LPGRGFGNAKVDHLWHGHSVVDADQDVRRLDVPMNDAFLMGVLDGMADLDKEFEPLPRAEMMLVAKLGDLNPAYQFHDEVGATGLRRAGVEDFGDVGMIHQGQCLALGFEAGDDRFGVHAQLDDLEGDASAHRFCLFGHVYEPAAAFTDLLEQFVVTDSVGGEFREWLVRSR
jgi:hypothetical protein